MNAAEESQNNNSHFKLITHPKIETRKISDPIYDFIYFDQDIWKVIDNPVFQRLRNIKQLGTTSWVFQGANHTRFEHCLGVGHLAQQFITSIYKNQPSLDNEEDRRRNIKLVTIAGIVHDLGHGPFSHMFDNLLIPKISDSSETWTHEVASERLFEYICDTYNVGLSKDDIQFVNALIQGDRDKISNGKKQWYYDIVSNKRNGIDVDRLDYIRRDCHHLGWPNYLKDFRFLMEESRVIDDEICYPQKYALNIFDFFNTRYKLYKTVYLNRISQAIEQMICDILLSVNDTYKFQEIIHQPEKYYKLNDSIIELIDNSDNPQFITAQKIIQRLKCRDLYKFVSEALIEEKTYIESTEKIKDQIITYLPSNSNINIDEIYVSSGKIGFGSKNSNPINNINFYRRSASQNKFIIEEQHMSYCLPVQYSEKFIRIFVSNNSAIQIVEEAFAKFCKDKFGLIPSNKDKTPVKIVDTSSFVSGNTPNDFSRLEFYKKNE